MPKRIIIVALFLLLVFFYPYFSLGLSYSESIKNFTKNIQYLGIGYPLDFYSKYLGISTSFGTKIFVPERTNSDSLYSLYVQNDIEKLVLDYDLGFLEVKAIDKTTGTFGAVVKLGKNVDNILQYTTISCPKDSTWVVSSKNKDLISKGLDIFDQAAKGDFILSSCIDSECKSYGKECVVVKGKLEN